MHFTGTKCPKCKQIKNTLLLQETICNKCRMSENIKISFINLYFKERCSYIMNYQLINNDELKAICNNKPQECKPAEI